MSYELDSPSPPPRGSRVAGNATSYVVNSRGAGTASASRARRVANGVSGYGNLAGYEGLGFSLLDVVKPIASFVPGGSLVTSGFNLASGLKPTNAKDPERLATAQSNLQKALAGDANAYLLLQQQAGLIPGYGSATQYGKDVAKAALAQYAAMKGTPPSGPTSMAPVVAPAAVAVAPAVTTGVNPNIDTSAPPLVRADMAGAGGGISPTLLIGVGIAAAMALKNRGR